MSTAKITIIILNWNGKKDTLQCLSSVLKINYQNFDVIVVDNGSQDSSITAIIDQFPSVQVIATGKNLGYAGGNNVGIKAALAQQSDYLLILNNDTVVDPDLLAQLYAATTRHPPNTIFGPRIFYAAEPDKIWFSSAHWNPSTLSYDFIGQGSTESDLPPGDTESDYICGAGFFCSTDLFRKIGLFEESDWCQRAQRFGSHCITVTNAKIWHSVASSFGNEQSPLRTYFSSRNRLLWTERNIKKTEHLKVLIRSLRVFLPRLSLSTDYRIPLYKRALWAVSGSTRHWSNPVFHAKQIGVRDYIFRRFGDCPKSVRDST